MRDPQELEARLQVTFRQPALLIRALTHRSYLNENPEDTSEDNERLEFLGDAVLDFLVGAYLYDRLPNTDEGELTALRAALVRAESLAEFARAVDLGDFLRLGVGEADSGGRERVANLCAAFEALVGALYLDQGLACVRALVDELVEPALARVVDLGLHKDAKSEFQVWAQSVHNITPHYVMIAAEGPDHAKEFTVEVRLKDEAWGIGQGRSKQAAAQEAALKALRRAETEQEKAG